MPAFISTSAGRTVHRAGFGTDKADGSGIAAAVRAKAAGANCFVLTIGGNDAMRARGNRATLRRSIDAMMTAIGRDSHIDWVTSTSAHPTAPWSMHNMQQLSVELDWATGRWPNLDVDHWERTPGLWLLWRPDGVHYTDLGNQIRGRYVVDSAFIRGSR